MNVMFVVVPGLGAELLFDAVRFFCTYVCVFYFIARFDGDRLSLLWLADKAQFYIEKFVIHVNSSVLTRAFYMFIVFPGFFGFTFIDLAATCVKFVFLLPPII
jgi:hypothetical protein